MEQSYSNKLSLEQTSLRIQRLHGEQFNGGWKRGAAGGDLNLKIPVEPFVPVADPSREQMKEWTFERWVDL